MKVSDPNAVRLMTGVAGGNSTEIEMLQPAGH